jgi:redox-sensitive bicupin YhaK (pirin superfamily)
MPAIAPGPARVRRGGPAHARPVRAHGPDGRGRLRPGEPKGTPWHPHQGFETVTYMIDGVFQHQDSNGGGGLITDGDTQWMTAGPGLSFW